MAYITLEELKNMDQSGYLEGLDDITIQYYIDLACDMIDELTSNIFIVETKVYRRPDINIVDSRVWLPRPILEVQQVLDPRFNDTPVSINYMVGSRLIESQYLNDTRHKFSEKTEVFATTGLETIPSAAKIVNGQLAFYFITIKDDFSGNTDQEKIDFVTVTYRSDFPAPITQQLYPYIKKTSKNRLI